MFGALAKVRHVPASTGWNGGLSYTPPPCDDSSFIQSSSAYRAGPTTQSRLQGVARGTAQHTAIQQAFLKRARSYAAYIQQESRKPVLSLDDHARVKEQRRLHVMITSHVQLCLLNELKIDQAEFERMCFDWSVGVEALSPYAQELYWAHMNLSAQSKTLDRHVKTINRLLEKKLRLYASRMIKYEQGKRPWWPEIFARPFYDSNTLQHSHYRDMIL